MNGWGPLVDHLGAYIPVNQASALADPYCPLARARSWAVNQFFHSGIGGNNGVDRRVEPDAIVCFLRVQSRGKNAEKEYKKDAIYYRTNYLLMCTILLVLIAVVQIEVRHVTG